MPVKVSQTKNKDHKLQNWYYDPVVSVTKEGQQIPLHSIGSFWFALNKVPRYLLAYNDQTIKHGEMDKYL